MGLRLMRNLSMEMSLKGTWGLERESEGQSKGLDASALEAGLGAYLRSQERM